MNNVEKIKKYVHSGDICIAAYHWGELDDSKQTIVLIHGYPDSAVVWNRIAERLAAQFNMVAYDVRGAGLSDMPEKQSQYSFDYLVNDLSAVIESVSPTKPVHVVGHDWGALQGWEAILDDRLKLQIKSYTAMAPSIDHVAWWFKRQWEQGSFAGYCNVIQRGIGSSYMALFLLPLMPELTWRLGLNRIWSNIVAKIEHITIDSDPQQLRNAISGLGLYRQNLLPSLSTPTTRITSIPVQMLVMTKDPFVPENISQGMQEWTSDIVYDQVQAGHWGILSHSTEVAESIRKFVLQKQ